MHGPFFAAPIGRAAQDHGLAGLGVARELDLDAFVDRAPTVRGGERRGELLQLRLRCADDVAPAGLAQPREIPGTGHAPVGDPDASQHSMPGLHGGYDRLQGPRIMGIAGEHLVAQGKAVEGHDQRDADLLAVGAMIARVAALRLRVGFRLALKVGACHVVEQHLVLDRKQLSAAPGQVRLERRLVHKQVIEAAIEAILGDLLLAKLQQIAERRAAVPVLSNVQLAGRLAEPCRYQHGRHLCPGDAFLARRQHLLAQLLKARPAPQCERQIHIAKLTRALDADALQAHRHSQLCASVVEQRCLLRGADQPSRKRPCLNASVLIELAKMRHRLLDDASPDAHAAHQPPIAVKLPVLPYRRVAQVHAPNQIQLAASGKYPRLALHAQIRYPRSINP